MANNFANPRLDRDCMEREMSAVESECKMHGTDDTVKMLQVVMS